MSQHDEDAKHAFLQSLGRWIEDNVGQYDVLNEPAKAKPDKT